MELVKRQCIAVLLYGLECYSLIIVYKGKGKGAYI